MKAPEYRAAAVAYRDCAKTVDEAVHGHPFSTWFVGEFNKRADEMDALALEDERLDNLVLFGGK